MQQRSRAPAATAEELFGQVLREIRKERAISQETLAFRSGYHPTYISQLERGKKSPSLRAMVSLGDALEIPASQLLKRVEVRLNRKTARPIALRNPGLLGNT